MDTTISEVYGYALHETLKSWVLSSQLRVIWNLIYPKIANWTGVHQGYTGAFFFFFFKLTLEPIYIPRAYIVK